MKSKRCEKLKKIKNQPNTSFGYSLIEILVSITIFSIAVAGPTGIFISSVRSQNRALSLRQTLDNVTYIIEYVSRALRMAKKEVGDPLTCLPSYGLNYATTTLRDLGAGPTTYSGLGIKFIHRDDSCREIFLDRADKRLKESRDGAAPLPLTSAALEVSFLGFRISGKGQDDNYQPRITMVLEIAGDASGLQKTKIQTTISQRNLDVMY